MRLVLVVIVVACLSPTSSAELNYFEIINDERFSGGFEDIISLKFGEPGNKTVEFKLEVASGSPFSPAVGKSELEFSFAASRNSESDLGFEFDGTGLLLGDGNLTEGNCFVDERVLTCWLTYEKLGMEIGGSINKTAMSVYWYGPQSSSPSSVPFDFAPSGPTMLFFDPVKFLQGNLLGASGDAAYYGSNYTLVGCTQQPIDCPSESHQDAENVTGSSSTGIASASSSSNSSSSSAALKADKTTPSVGVLAILGALGIALVIRKRLP